MNWFKKKIISVALIGSLVVGISGQAVFASEASTLNTTLTAINDALTTIEKGYVATAKTKFDAYVASPDNSAGDDIWGKIELKILNETPIDKIKRETVNGLFAKLSLLQLSVGSSSLSLSSDESAMLTQLAGVVTIDPPASWEEEVAQFVNQVQVELQNNASSLALTVLANSSGDLTSSVITAIKNILKSSNTISNNKIVQILKAYSITANDLNSLINAVRLGVGTVDFDNANNAILFGFFRLHSDLTFISGANPATYKLSAFGTDLSFLSPIIDWTSSAGTTVTEDADGHIILSGTPGSVQLNATLDIPSVTSLDGKNIYNKTITLAGATPTPTSSSVTGNSATPTAAPVVIPTPAPEKAIEAGKGLDIALAAIPTPAPGQDGQSGLKVATKAVEDAIEKLSHLDVSKSVIVTGDTVKVEIDTNQFKDLFKTVKDNADKLNDKLAAFDPNAEKAKITVTLDLGKQDANNAEVPITTDLVKVAKDSGIDKIAVQVNGVSLAADVDQFKVNTTLNIEKKEAKEATDVTTLKVASDVYNFEFTEAGGNPVTFTKPVTIKLPIADTTNVNTDLLTLAKIINGKLEYYGGKYNSAGKYFQSSRKSFSTYVIVENKVNFTDTSSVSAWAGNDIAIAAAKGIIQGRGEGIFAPNDKVTRAEFAAMIVKTFHLEDATAVSSFSDVKAEDWFASSVAAAAKAGLITGRTTTSFEPNATISRAEMATISARALKSVKGYKNTSDNAAVLANFKDAATINASLTEGVALASSQGIVIGNENNFNPDGLSTRAEAAVVISRLLNK